MAITYAVQPEPKGLAQAYHIGADFVRRRTPSVLILGDNIFYGHGLPELLRAADARADHGATVFGYYVKDPHAVRGRLVRRRRAVPRRSRRSRSRRNRTMRSPACISTMAPRSTAPRRSGLRPRGELEITDLNRAYLDDGALEVALMGRGFAWLDTGTHASLLDAALYVRIVEERQGLKICCPEEIAWRLRASSTPPSSNASPNRCARAAMASTC